MKKLSVYTYPQTIQPKVKSSTAVPIRLGRTEIHIRLLLQYLNGCLRYKAIPWNFFQLNSEYFSESKGIFSKLEMDKHIPEKWRLKQYYFDQDVVPDSFPVFLKPEWGQNSIGIACIGNSFEYKAFDAHVQKAVMPYIVQQAASGSNEFEIYYLRSPECREDCAVLSITQVKNNHEGYHPINSVHNPNTVYLDITPTFGEKELQTLWNYLKTIGNFRMARVCIKAESKAELCRGIFQIIEINLFLPMPLVLLASNVSAEKKQQELGKIMMVTARLVKTIPPKETGKSIFFPKMKAHYRTL